MQETRTLSPSSNMYHGSITYPAIRTPQGTHSNTWTAPPFDEPRTIPGLFEFSAKHSQDHPALPHSDLARGVCAVSTREVYLAIRQAARIVTERVGSLSPAADGSRPAVGILAVSGRLHICRTSPCSAEIYSYMNAIDTISYVTLMVGIMLAGGVAFPISTRNSSAAVANHVY